MKQLRGVLFDLDGTIFNTEPLHHQFLRKAFRKETGRSLPLSVLRPYIGLPYRDRLREVFAILKINNKRLLERVAQQAAILFEREFRPHNTTLDGLRPLLEELRRAKVKMGIVSSAAHDRIHENMIRAAMFPYFSVIIGRDDVHEHKPNPAPYCAGRDGLNVPIEEILAFEDSPLGIASATGAGLRVIGIQSSMTQLPNTTLSVPDYQMLSLKTLNLLVQ